MDKWAAPECWGGVGSCQGGPRAVGLPRVPSTAGWDLSPEPKDSSQCHSSEPLGQEQSGRPSCGRWYLRSWSKHRQQAGM